MRYRGTATIALAIGAAAGLVRFAAAPGAEPPRGAPAADYVVLADVSGSMDQPGRYPALLTALPRLLDGLDPADRVSLYTFDSTVHSRYSGAGLGGDRLVAQLPGTANVAASTDLGPPIAAGLDELRRPDGAPIRTVVLVTDGMHDPPPESEYADLSGPAWAELARRAGEAGDANTAFYTVLVGAGDFDAAQATRIFPSGTVVRPVNAAELEDAFAAARARVATMKRQLTAVPVAPGGTGTAPLDGAAAGAGLAGAGVLAIGAAAAAVLVVRRRRPVLSGELEVSSGREPVPSARIPLAGHRMALDDDGIEGVGSVAAVRGGAELMISYTALPGAKPITRRCAAGKPIILGGYTFTYHTDSTTAERRSRSA
ncbi:vWA domain-containing protein [Nocardia asteroides]|uniref:vWA domain-containing protein n=1 Tax=Nocardia asteroides TaxID=1824 RepID=UPI001E28F5B8|nr:vWA domain-containing protein [Nocardia asteroides]UGT62489.1 VWA domain-containing protein [Nocardia asteroides]